jgi:hypothetical protein
MLSLSGIHLDLSDGLPIFQPCNRRMDEVRAAEVAETLEDLMYVSILEKFVLLRVEMLPRLDGQKIRGSEVLPPCSSLPASCQN